MKIKESITRKKKIRKKAEHIDNLKRALTSFDLTLIGVGSTLGAGVYVVVGSVANQLAGPSVILALILSAFSSILTGLCFAEMGARVPSAGSCYVYAYVCIGELTGFLIGWSLIASYILGAASCARGFTASVDFLTGEVIERALLDCCKMNISGFAEYPDLVAFAIIISLSGLVAAGVKELSIVNTTLTFINLSVIALVVIVGYINLDIHNWNWTSVEIKNFLNQTGNETSNCSIVAENHTCNPQWITQPINYGSGGFMPHGVLKFLSGTATCVFAFVGIDSISASGEEAINPSRTIPLSTMLSLAICCLCYVGVSSSITLMQPYFLIDVHSPLPYAFQYVGVHWVGTVVSIGAICAMLTGVIGSLYPLPRVFYKMAQDGLICKTFSTVNQKTKTPVYASFVTGSFTAIVATIFDLKTLVDLTSIAMLLAFTLVAICVIILRYKSGGQEDEISVVSTKTINRTYYNLFVIICNPESKVPTKKTSKLVNICTILITLATCVFSIVLRTCSFIGASVASVICGIIIIGLTLVIYRQPSEELKLSFKVPFVPVIPVMNILINICVMIQLDVTIWYKIVIWIAFGFAIYFGYGIRHSLEGKKKQQDEDKELKELSET